MPVPMPPKNDKNNKGTNWGRLSKTLSFWILILLIPVALIQLSNNRTDTGAEIRFDQYREQLAKGNVADVTIQAGKNVTGTFREPVTISNKPTKKFITQFAAKDSPAEVELLMGKGVQITSQDPKPSLRAWVVNFLPWLLLIGFYLFLFKQMQAGGAKAFSFGKSKAKLLTGDTPKITFADVAGADEAKEELQEIIEFLRDPQKYTKLGGRLPKGALLVGPPGTGKTLLARAVAGGAGRAFFSMSGSDFVEMFVGVGASRVRDLFEQGKAHAPCIIFIDEIDAVGRHRGAGLGGGHDEREQTLNQLLVEMDGFESNEGVILIAATNRPDVLDPALLRPGRFDRRVIVDRPDIRGRENILEVHSRNKPLDTGVDPEVLPKQTPGFSGADLSNLIIEAAILAARGNRKVIVMNDLEESIARVIAGPERKSRMISEKEKLTIAFHEMGHALVGTTLEHTDPVHKVTIVSRGQALGWTMSLPIEDRYLVSKAELVDQLAQILGGRCAEDLILGEDNITTGASDDHLQS